MSHAIVRTDEAGRITSWDAGAEKLFGHSADSAIGQPVDLIIPEPFRAAHWAGFHRAMRDPQIKDMAADLPVLCADGIIREFAGRLLALSDGLGVAIGAMAIYRTMARQGLSHSAVKASRVLEEVSGIGEKRMNLGPRRWMLVVVFTLVAAMGCAPAATPPSPSSPATTPPSATTSSTPAGTSPEYAALEAEIDNAISTGPATLDNVRAVLVNVDGETKIAHYRHGFTGNDHLHVFSVTKSVLSTLIGIAIADGLIDDIDQPLIELLPKHRQAMSGDAAKVTLRHLMTMSGGFHQFPGGFVWVDAAKPGNSFIDVLLKRRQQFEPGEVFWYSDASAHMAAAVLAAALERADGDRPRTILDYAREKLFDPLGISTQPSFSGPVPDPLLTPDFVAADFGWGTDPNGIQLGGIGLRLTAPDMMKIGELYRRGGVWNGQQIVPSAWIRQCTSPARFERRVNSPTDLDYGLFWWIIAKPRGAGYLALGFGGQRILVLPKSRAVIVYMSDVQSNSYIEDARDLEPLDKVLHDAFLR